MAATAPATQAPHRADEPGMQRMPLSTRQDVEDAFTWSPTSLVAVAARVRGELVGMVAPTFETGVSFDPPRALLSVRSGSRTWRSLRHSRTLGISLLSEQQGGLVRQLSSRTGDRFASLDPVETPDGAALLPGAALWLEAQIDTEIAVADHQLVLLAVADLRSSSEARPLIYWHRGLGRIELAAGPAVPVTQRR